MFHYRYKYAVVRSLLIQLPRIKILLTDNIGICFIIANCSIEGASIVGGGGKGSVFMTSVFTSTLMVFTRFALGFFSALGSRGFTC